MEERNLKKQRKSEESQLRINTTHVYDTITQKNNRERQSDITREKEKKRDRQMQTDITLPIKNYILALTHLPSYH